MLALRKLKDRNHIAGAEFAVQLAMFPLHQPDAVDFDISARARGGVAAQFRVQGPVDAGFEVPFHARVPQWRSKAPLGTRYSLVFEWMYLILGTVLMEPRVGKRVPNVQMLGLMKPSGEGEGGGGRLIDGVRGKRMEG